MVIDKKKFWQRTYKFLILWGILAIIYSIILIIDSYPEFPKDLRFWFIVVFILPPLWLILNIISEYFIVRKIADGLNKIGENKLRTVNKILTGIIIVPIVILLLIGLIISIIK